MEHGGTTKDMLLVCSGQRMRFTGQGGERCRDLGDVRAHVGRGDARIPAAVVAGEGPGDGITVVALDPSQRRVPQPMRGDLLSSDPGQVSTEALPEVIVSAGADGTATPIAQQLPGRLWGPLVTVLEQTLHQGGGHRLPSNRLALLPQPHEALVDIEIGGAQRQRTAATARGLEMQPKKQEVEIGVIARRPGNLVDLSNTIIGKRPARARQPARFGHDDGGIALRRD